MRKKQKPARRRLVNKLGVLMPCGICTSHSVVAGEESNASPQAIVPDWPANA